MFRAAVVVLCLFALASPPAPAQVAGPLYELLDQYREFRSAGAETPEDMHQWAEALMAGLDAYPNEEWSTRIRAYEEAGSIYWRNNEFEAAAPIFLDLWQESEQRGDTDNAVTSIDHLINLYTEAHASPEDILALYDATESWLQEPGPGQEAEYEKLLRELYYERAGRLNTFAQAEDLTDAQRNAYLEEAAYFANLASGMAARTHVLKQTMAGLIAHWAANTVDPAKPARASQSPAPEAENKAAEPEWPTLPPPKAPVPAAAAAPEPPAVPLEPIVTGHADDSSEDNPPVPAAAASGWVVPASIAIIFAGWALAAFIYLKRRQ